MADPKEQLMAASSVINTAVALLRSEQPTFEAFLEECRNVDSFGHIVDPTLFRDPERRAVSALMNPLYEAALDFIRAYDEQTKRAKAALEKVKAPQGAT
ncbi:MAG TPA: hypothetical protein VKW08_08075 [Xanthobacteraceae bacterium]|jgi:hypothetical protein|nr:hypothetical protein [Xanthobacteraceae bacterium]